MPLPADPGTTFQPKERQQLWKLALPSNPLSAFFFEAAFLALKTVLMNSPVLRNPDFQRFFLVHMDTSETGLGAMPSQGQEHPIISINWKLTPTEQRYPMEQKALTMEELLYYLAGRQFTLIREHAPLLWMTRAKNSNNKITRWFLPLQGFLFQVQQQAKARNCKSRWPLLTARTLVQLFVMGSSKLG